MFLHCSRAVCDIGIGSRSHTTVLQKQDMEQRLMQTQGTGALLPRILLIIIIKALEIILGVGYTVLRNIYY